MSKTTPTKAATAIALDAAVAAAAVEATQGTGATNTLGTSQSPHLAVVVRDFATHRVGQLVAGTAPQVDALAKLGQVDASPEAVQRHLAAGLQATPLPPEAND